MPFLLRSGPGLSYKSL